MTQTKNFVIINTLTFSVKRIINFLEETIVKKSIRMIALAVVLLCALAITSCGGGAAGDLKVGFVDVGPIGDEGYTYAHDQGRLALLEELGVETVYVDFSRGADDYINCSYASETPNK